MATKIVTKNSSTASAVPTASDLVQGELAVNVADKRLFTEDNGGAIVELGTNPSSLTVSGNIDVDGVTNLDAVDIDGAVDMASTLTVTGEITANGGIALGDNDKATFGAGDDLQIYHDGSASRIHDAGTGDLIIAGQTNIILGALSGEEYLRATENGAVSIKHDNVTKLATTSTGIDVTGTATMDGLSVDGNVGIGTSGYGTYSSGDRVLSLGSGTTIRGSASGVPYLTAVSNGYFDGTNWKYAQNHPATNYEQYNGSHTFSYAASGTAGNNITFSEAMRIDSSGNVGIGTSSPSQKLHVDSGEALIKSAYSTAGTTNSKIYFASRDNGDWHNTFIGNTSDALTFATGGTGTTHTNATERMRIDSSGNVGIGRTPTNSLNPSLEIKDGGSIFGYGDALYIASNLYYDSGWKAMATGGGAKYVPDSNGHRFYTNASASAGGAVTPTERMRIDSSGNLLVGTTSASAKLFVEKSSTGNAFGVRATDATYAQTVGFFGADRNTTNNTFHYIDCYNYGSSSYRFRVADSGNVTNTNNSYGAISDIKLKENIVDATPKLDKLNEVRIVNYNFIGSDEKQLGVIAQELEQIMPNMVDENVDKDEDGNELGTTTKTVKYSVFVPMLIKAMQEQTEIINNLRNRVAQLEE